MYIHTATTDYVNNFLPLSVMPTRITDTSANIIDHIQAYYFEGRYRKKDYAINYGSIWFDITDHLPIFVIITQKIEKNPFPYNSNSSKCQSFSENNYKSTFQ